MPDKVTLVYKTVYASDPSLDSGSLGIPLHLDLYLPDFLSSGASTSGDNGIEMPVIVYFHAGGLAMGDRKSWFPDWLQSEHRFRFRRSVPLRDRSPHHVQNVYPHRL